MKPLDLNRLPDEYFRLPGWLELVPNAVMMAWLALFIASVYLWPGRGLIPVHRLFWQSLVIVVLIEVCAIAGLLLLLLHLAGVI